MWARNPHSKSPASRLWHWIDFHTVQKSGAAWKPKRARTGRQLRHGYVFLTMGAMTDEEIALADKFQLWTGGLRATGRCVVAEHRLVALKKYGILPKGVVIRHLNGIKQDNRPENLLRGTVKENNMDHDKAIRMAMYWREQYEALFGRIKKQRHHSGQEVIDV